MITLDYMTQNNELSVILADVTTQAHVIVNIPESEDNKATLKLMRDSMHKLSQESVRKMQAMVGL